MNLIVDKLRSNMYFRIGFNSLKWIVHFGKIWFVMRGVQKIGQQQENMSLQCWCPWHVLPAYFLSLSLSIPYRLPQLRLLWKKSRCIVVYEEEAAAANQVQITFFKVNFFLRERETRSCFVDVVVGRKLEIRLVSASRRARCCARHLWEQIPCDLESISGRQGDPILYGLGIFTDNLFPTLYKVK